MTEITRVPLQPIAKGALGKLWLGVAGAVVLAGGLAVAAMPPLVKVETLKAGDGPVPTMQEVPFVNYTGMLPSGKEFDKGREVPFPPGRAIPGFSQALLQMHAGGKYKVTIPSELAYGKEGAHDPRTGAEVIPPNSDLVFEIELLGSMPPEQYQQFEMMRQMQMQQQMQQMQGGKDQAPPPGGPAEQQGR